MNKILFGSTVSFLILLLIAAAVGGILIYSENEKDLIDMADRASDSMASELSAAMSRRIYPGTEEFGSRSNSFFSRYRGLYSFAVFTDEDGIYYLKTAGPGLINEKALNPDIWKGKIPYSDKASEEIIELRTIRLDGVDKDIRMEMLFLKSLTPGNYRIGLTLFFIITALLIAVVFTLVFSDTGREAPAAGIETSPPESQVQIPVSSAPVSAPEPVSSVQETAPAPTAVTVPSPETNVQSQQPAAPVQETPSAPAEAPVPCLYSRKTGFVKQELLSDKLDQELKRSASFDQDLVLVVFSFGGEKTAENKDFQKIILESFPYKDLVFEYGSGSYAIIIPNVDLEIQRNHN